MMTKFIPKRHLIRTSILTFLLLAATGATLAQTGIEGAESAESTKSSVQQIGLLATQLSDAIAAGDIETLKTILVAEVLIFESGGVESSLAEYEGHHMPADMAFMKAMTREVISQQVFDSGDSATVATRSHVHGIYKDQEIDVKSTETLVLQKVNGHWKVVHIHWSSS